MAEANQVQEPVSLIVLGMAGSGKSSLIQHLVAKLHEKQSPPYVVNLDPACLDIDYPVNIDIRDTVKYRDVMKKYKLGPNGAIITSLNLFATKFDQVLSLIEKRKSQYQHIIIDTPGQIEVFTWSASGSIITEALAATLPTVVLYVLDLEKCQSSVTFMSNMLYACSILYKAKLPFIIALNKTDVCDAKKVIEWITDWEAYESSLNDEESYAGNLARSLSLVLDKFYSNIQHVPVSAVTGDGLEELLSVIQTAKSEFYEIKKEQEELRRQREKEKAEEEEQEEEPQQVGDTSS